MTTYTPSGNPATGSEGLSGLMRAEFLAIAAAFNGLPAITTTGVFNTIFAQLGNFTFTLPPIGGSLALVTDVTTAVAAEATARAAAVSAEATTRAAAVSAEATTRATADTTNAAAITAEANARISAIAVLTGMTWHNVTGSRVLNTTYTNSNAYPISVIVVSATSGGGGGTVLPVTVNGNLISTQSSAAAGNYTASFQVPAGQTYNVGLGGSMTSWFELF